MTTKSLCPIGCEPAIRGAWIAFGLEEAQPRKAKTAAAPTPGAFASNQGEPSPDIKLARRLWVTKVRAVTACRARHWPSTPDEARELQSRLLWGPSDMWSAIKNRDDEGRARNAGKSSRREGEQRTAQAQAPDGNAQQREASRPAPAAQQRQSARPPASDGDGPRYDSEPVLSIQLPLICLRPPYQGMRWDLSHSERARRFAVEKSLIAFKEFQATMREEVEKHANAYLAKPPTERSLMEFQKDTETYYQLLAKDLYKTFEADMKRKLADIQNGVPDTEDPVANLNTNNVRPSHQAGRFDESDLNGPSVKWKTSNGQQRDTHQTEGQFRQREAHPGAMPPVSQYPSHAGNSFDDPTKSQGWEHHRRSHSDKAHEFGSLPSTQFLDPNYVPVRDHRQKHVRNASVPDDSTAQRGPTSGSAGGRHQYPNVTLPGRAASALNSARPPPPKVRPGSAPLGHRVPSSSSYGATPLQYMPTKVDKTAAPEMTDPDADDLRWLDQYMSDQHVAEQYMTMANAFRNKDAKLDEEYSEALSDLEEGRLQRTRNAMANAAVPAPAPASTMRSAVTPKTPKVAVAAVPPLVASGGSNTGSDSDATISDSTIQSESENEETPTQSTYNSPLAGTPMPKVLSSFIARKLPPTTRQTALKTAGGQAAERIMRPERREVHFAGTPAVRYFRG